MEVQQGAKMDVSDKKEQRKESELDERWLKLTTKGTPKTGLDCKRSCTLLLFEVLKFDMERGTLECCWRRWREWIARKK